MRKRLILSVFVGACLVAGPLLADDDDDDGHGKGNGQEKKQQQQNLGGGVNCEGLPESSQLGTWLQAAFTQGNVGGLFGGQFMWGAVVNRDGELCSFTTSTADPRKVWPGSQAIAKAKAFTANAFSNDQLPLSTARLYTLTQPGHSLSSLGQSNLFDPAFLAPAGGQGGGKHHIAGGMIFFGGGVPLYKNGTIIGGLGVSGDTACADHEVAKRVRTLAGLNPAGGAGVDDIIYGVAGDTVPSLFVHPLCVNTFRNSVFVGNEPGRGAY